MNGPSIWVRRWAHLWPAGGSVLDVACGSGRHVRWLADRGLRVTALDRDTAALEGLSGVAAETIAADIENAPWPLAGRRFHGVLVTNYLHRPLYPALLESLHDGGVLLHETFSRGQALIGRPSNPAFLLAAGELLELVRPLRVIAFEDGFETDPQGPAGSGRYVQRIAAVREAADPAAFPQYPLG